MNFNDIDEMAFEFAKILLTASLNEALTKAAKSILTEERIVADSYKLALAFQKEGRKHHVSPCLP